MKIIDCSLPYDSFILKNKRYGFSKKGVYVRRGVRQVEVVYENIIKKTIKENYSKEDIQKVLLQILVHRTNFKYDAINIIDSLADIVKKVIGIDDRYFSVSLDWVMDKKDFIELQVHIYHLQDRK